MAVTKNLAIISQKIYKYCSFGCLGCKDFHRAHVWIQTMPMKPGRKFLSAADEMIMIQFHLKVPESKDCSLGQCHNYSIKTK